LLFHHTRLANRHSKLVTIYTRRVRLYHTILKHVYVSWHITKLQEYNKLLRSYIDEVRNQSLHDAGNDHAKYLMSLLQEQKSNEIKNMNNN